MAKPPTSNAPGSPWPVWYEDGLRFSCQEDCGSCCTDHGDYVYVYLARGDARRLADHLGCEKADFLERYASVEDRDRVLSMRGPDCTFLRDKRCTVYPARPTQCRTFPFWEDNLRSPRHWHRLGEFCPGIDVGETQTFDTIQRHLDERRFAERPLASSTGSES